LAAAARNVYAITSFISAWTMIRWSSRAHALLKSNPAPGLPIFGQLTPFPGNANYMIDCKKLDGWSGLNTGSTLRHLKWRVRLEVDDPARRARRFDLAMSRSYSAERMRCVKSNRKNMELNSR